MTACGGAVRAVITRHAVAWRLGMTVGSLARYTHPVHIENLGDAVRVYRLVVSLIGERARC
jgi:hypothetical protein